MKQGFLAVCAAILILSTAQTAWAGVYTADMASSGFGYSADDIAINQGVVAYWIAHGYANIYSGYPAAWADVQSKNMPLATEYYSPHTGDVIDLDDGSLDFPGDMTFSVGLTDVDIAVQTSSGVVHLPGTLSGEAKCSANAGCMKCSSCKLCDISIQGWDCWKCPNEQACICELAQWLINKSFDTYVCRYGTYPASAEVWIGSGLAPITADYRKHASYMEIAFVGESCWVKKAKVKCCAKCMPCENSIAKCGVQNGCAGGKCGWK